MFKQVLIFVLISILVAVFSNFTHNIIVYAHLLFLTVKNLLAPIFASLGLGLKMQKACLLILIPLTITCIPALIYRLIRGKTMPYFIEATWVFWLILVLSTILIG